MLYVDALSNLNDILSTAIEITVEVALRFVQFPVFHAAACYTVSAQGRFRQSGSVISGEITH